MKHRLVILLGAFALITACQPVVPEEGSASSLATDLEVSLTPSALKAEVFIYNIGGKCNVKGTDTHTIKISVFKASQDGVRESLVNPPTESVKCIRGTYSAKIDIEDLPGFKSIPYALDIKVDLEGRKKRDVATVTDTQEFKIP